MAPTPSNTEITPKIDSDAVARAASERADRLEKQNKELKEQLAQRAPKSKDADTAELKAELERMRGQYESLLNKLEAAAMVAGQAKREPRPLEAKHKGVKHYRSTQPFYKGGRMYNPGEIITVTDERPSKHWTLVEKVVKTEFVDAPSEPTTPAVRDADQQV